MARSNKPKPQPRPAARCGVCGQRIWLVPLAVHQLVAHGIRGK